MENVIKGTKSAESKEVSNSSKDKKKKKILKIAIIIVSALLVIFLVLMLLNYILCHDTNRGNIENKGLDNQEIIKKNYIDGYSNTKEDGFFRFELPKEDINQMLSNSVKELGDKKIESIYYETENDHHIFYVDIKPCLFNTRVKLDCVSYIDNENKKVELQIVDATMGKFPILSRIKSKNYLTSEFIGKISKYSAIPVSFNEDTNIFIVELTKYFDMFPTGDLSNALLSVARENPNNIKITSLFGFSLDLRSLRGPEHKSSKDKSPVVDPIDRLNNIVHDTYVYDILPGDSRTLTALSLDEYSDYLRGELKDYKETYTSTLTSNTLEFKLNDLYASFKVGKVTYMFNISINGYVVDASFESNVDSSSYDASLGMTLYKNVSVGTISKDKDNEVSKLFFSYFEESLKVISEKYDFFTYNPINSSISLDFSSIGEDIIGIEMYDRILKLDEVSLDRFVFVISLA